MGSGNWIIDNLNTALGMWNAKLAEIWMLLTQSPQSFKDGAVWNVIVDINGALKAIGFGLLVLFFVMGVMKTAGSFTEIKRPEHAFKLFIRFVLAKAAITWCMDIMLAFFGIAQGAISTIMSSSGLELTGATVLPQEIITAITNVGFWDSIPLWIVTLIGCLLIWVLSLVMVLTVYGRYFKIFMATAIAPIPLAGFAGEPSANIGKSFLKTYAALCLQGCVIVLACIIFSAFMSAPPALGNIEGLSAVTIVWQYVGELLFNMLVLVGAIKTSDRLIRELMGLQ
jgi:hypothetical protein